MNNQAHAMRSAATDPLDGADHPSVAPEHDIRESDEPGIGRCRGGGDAQCIRGHFLVTRRG